MIRFLTYFNVLNVMHVAAPVVHFDVASTLATWTQRSDASMYADISDAAGMTLNYTRKLIKQYVRTDF